MYVLFRRYFFLHFYVNLYFSFAFACRGKCRHEHNITYIIIWMFPKIGGISQILQVIRLNCNIEITMVTRGSPILRNPWQGFPLVTNNGYLIQLSNIKF